MKGLCIVSVVDLLVVLATSAFLLMSYSDMMLALKHDANRNRTRAPTVCQTYNAYHGCVVKKPTTKRSK